jgi:glycerol-3-phosphate dehydrogenase
VSVSFPNRKKLWRDLADGTLPDWDIIIVGGGITGAGILREAVKRGYRCLLVEQRDFAWGTSSRSSKMVHGGFRYLAAGNFTLTRHALQERERLVREAPRLVERLGYYFPLYKKKFPPRFAAGILFWLYDRIAGIRNHRSVSNQELNSTFAQLDTGDMNGAFYYTDAITDDARLTLRVLHEAVTEGGFVLNYSKATRLTETDDRVRGVTLQDAETGEQQSVCASVVINATGAWANRLGEEPEPGLTIRPQRGSHLVLSAEKFPVSDAIFLQHPGDSRRLFIYPWEGRTVVGTTDIFHPQDLDTAASITQQELDYLLTAAGLLFTRTPPVADDVISSWSGVRPIIASNKPGDPSSASREHKVWVENGMVSCSGGKLTTFHHMAVDVLDQAREFLPPASQTPGQHMFRPVTCSGAEILPENPLWGEKLLGRYGDSARGLVDAATEATLLPVPGGASCLAELRWSIEHEAVIHLDDLMLRRSRLGILLKNGGEEVLDQVRQLFVEGCGWDEQRWAKELDRYRETIRRHYTLPFATSSA